MIAKHLVGIIDSCTFGPGFIAPNAAHPVEHRLTIDIPTTGGRMDARSVTLRRAHDPESGISVNKLPSRRCVLMIESWLTHEPVLAEQDLIEKAQEHGFRFSNAQIRKAVAYLERQGRIAKAGT